MAVLTDGPVFVDDSSEPRPPTPVAVADPNIRWLLAGLSAGAAVVHFGYAPSHFSQYSVYGVFFVVIAWLQVAWAVAVVARPTSRLLLAGLVGNELVVAVWAASRTMGVLVGPNSGAKEAVGYPDVLCTVLEVAVGAGCLALLARPDLRLPGVRTARRAATVVGAVLLVVVAASAYALTPHFTAEHDHAAGAGHTHGGAALTGTTPCEKAGPPASEGQVVDTEGHFHRGPQPQVGVDAATRTQLEAQQVQARAVVDRFPTVANAERAGYQMSTPYVPCIGAHYTKIDLARQFDPTAPSELLYDGTQPTSRIVGLSYLVYHPGGAPDGFAGPNDRWHQHTLNGGLCFNRSGVVIASESSSEAQCAALGGFKIPLTDVWMLHDWVVPGFECSWGVFAPECPELGGRTGGTAWDTPKPGQSLSG